MVSNIGHSHPRVNDAIQRQLNQVAFAYRLHFENDAAEEFARDLFPYLKSFLLEDKQFSATWKKAEDLFHLKRREHE